MTVNYNIQFLGFPIGGGEVGPGQTQNVYNGAETLLGYGPLISIKGAERNDGYIWESAVPEYGEKLLSNANNGWVPIENEMRIKAGLFTDVVIRRGPSKQSKRRN